MDRCGWAIGAKELSQNVARNSQKFGDAIASTGIHIM